MGDSLNLCATFKINHYGNITKRQLRK